MKKIAAFCLILISLPLFAQTTAFLYQGSLSDGTNFATGTYNFTFSLYTTNNGGTPAAGPILTNGVRVVNGLFSAELNFGSALFTGKNYWLQIDVETNGSRSLTALAPRQPLLPVPYAIAAGNASNLLGTLPAARISGSIPSSEISGTIPSSKITGAIPVTQLTGKIPASSLTGTIAMSQLPSPVILNGHIYTGNGAGLQNVNAAQLGGIVPGGFSQTATNTIYVSPSGNNSTGQRGTGYAFANLYAAVAVAQPGDVIYVEKGTYNEGSHVVGIPPKDLSIHGLGEPVIIYTLTNAISGLVSNNIYMEPADNLLVDGLVFSTPSAGYFSAFFGNDLDCPSATNVQISISSLDADSDGFYFEGQNLLTLFAFNCVAHGYWDTFATYPTLNTNDVLCFKSCEFDVDYVNGSNPSQRRSINVNSGGNLIFENCRIHDALPELGVNYGIQIENPNANVVLNGIGFNDGGPGYADIFVLSPTYNVALNNLFSETANELVISPSFPNQVGGSQLFGRLNVPMNVSQYPGSGPVFGSWNLYDEGTNGTMILTNENNAAANIPAYIEFQPNDDAGDGSGNPLGGALNLHNMVLSLQTNYSPLNFAPPEPGQVNFVVSNNWIWTVTATATNRQFQISP